MIKPLFLLLILFFIVACTPETIIKYQCEDGEIVDSIELCQEQKCPDCPICPTMKCKNITQPYTEEESYEYTLKHGVIEDSTTGIIDNSLNWVTTRMTKIKNFDDKGGNFMVRHHYRTLHKEGTEEAASFINTGETVELKTIFDTEMGEDVEVTTDVIPAKETRSRKVIKEKEIEICSCE